MDTTLSLLTFAAGTSAFPAEHGIGRVVLIIHEFVTSITSKRKLEWNYLDLTKFYCRIAHQNAPLIVPGVLYGPISLSGEPLFEQNI